MSTTTITFRVELSAVPTPTYYHTVYVTEESVITELTRLGFRIVNGPIPGRIGEVVEVAVRDSDRKLEKAFHLLKQHGQQPYDGPVVPASLRMSHFAPRRERVFDPHRKMHAEYFRPHSVFFGNASPGTFIGHEDGRLKVAVDKRQKNHGLLGHLDPLGAPLVATKDFFDAMKNAGFREATWTEVRYDRPGQVIKRLGVLSSTVVMPPSLLPRVDEQGEAWQENPAPAPPTQPQHRCSWNDGGHVPEILRFVRGAVAELEPFDLAITREHTGTWPDEYLPNLIVSRRFCEFVDQQKVLRARWVPVRLLTYGPGNG